MSKGLSLATIENKLWEELSAFSLPGGATLEVFQSQDPRKMTGLRDAPARGTISRLPITPIKGRFEQREIGEPYGDTVTVEFDGDEFTGPAAHQMYEQEVWVSIQYQLRYVAKSIELDRALSELLLKLHVRGYLNVEEGGETTAVFIEQASPLTEIVAVEKSGVFERAMTWKIETALKAEPKEIVPTITSFVISEHFEV